ncbi:MAG: hypothetical protein Q7V01_04875 [Vicinamibacterales bacterium]|nr:hypothetical protein [Vicinamibacterales bacterium]
MTDDELNRAIDTVARDMVSAESPASLPAAVTARIEEDRRGRGVAFSRWAWAAAGTAVVVVAVGTWLVQPTDQPHSEGSFVTVSTPAGTPPVTSSGTPPVTVATTGAPPPVTARVRTPSSRPPHGLAWEAGPEPLAGPEPIVIDALSPDSLEIPEIHIAPIADIEPITIPAAGPGLPEPQRRDSR